MENANDEFTWLSGPAHQSIVREAQSSDSNKRSSNEKPLPRPRHQNALSDSPSHGGTPHERPTPLPRAMVRPESKSVYEVPPSLPNSVFYVATPKTLEKDQRPPPTLPTVDPSVILEFDPIYQGSKSESRQTTSVFYVDPVPGSLPKKAVPPAISLSSLVSCQASISGASSSASGPYKNAKNLGDSRIEECPSSYGVSDRKSNKLDVSQSLNASKVTRSASSSSSLSSLLRNSTLSSTTSAPANFHNASKGTQETRADPTTPVSVQTPTPASTSLPKNYCISSDIVCNNIKVETETDPNNKCQSQTQQLVLSQSQRSPQNSMLKDHPNTGKRPTPIPKPRNLGTAKTTLPESLPRTNTNKLKCTLSTVPPPPQHYIRHQLKTANEPIVRESISVQNPFYMFVEGGRTSPIVVRPTKDQQTSLPNSDSDSSSSSSSTGSDFEAPPPAFPPPPLPPLNDNGFTISDSMSGHDAKERFTDLESVKLNATLQTSTAPMSNGGKTESSVETKTPSSITEPPCANNNRWRMASAIPIYQNLMELCNSAREGVYAKINKLGKPISAEVPAPPPLPPRQQQQQAPPPPPIYPHPSLAIRVPLNRSNFDDAGAASQQESTLDDAQEPSITHHGVLYKIGRGRKDIVQKWIQLESGNLLCYADDTQDCLQEMFHRSGIISIAKGAASKLSQELSCFELAIQSKDRVQVFGARYLSECEVWIKVIVQTLAPRATGMTSRGVIKAGKVEVRNSVTGVWQRGWLVLCGKRLEVCIRDEVPIMLDLRKVILLQDFEKDPRMSDSDDGSPIFLINYPAITLYVRTSKSFDTQDWSRRIRQIMADTGSELDEQQLTHDGVPVIIYKCIEFVSTYGMTSQGIYRQSATNSRIARLLDSFRKDAQGIRLQQGSDGDTYTEHEVANALKRYLRTLPDSLLTSTLYQRWIAVAAAGSPAIEYLVTLLHQLPEINYQTLKKIVAHLYSISRHSDANLMTVTNLAQVFGPTLFSDNDENIPNAHLEMDITSCLITNYPALFGVSVEEIEKEEQFQKALRDLREAKKAQKPAGDILVGVYIHDRQWGKCLNVKMCIRDTIQALSVFEVVCNGHLERPLHYSENVLTVILRWASWADIDSKDNYLVIKRNEIYPKVLPLARQPLSMFGELRFADNKSKHFKKMMFEFKNARLAFYKDAKISQPLGMWNIEDITWYIGAESRRPPPNSNLPHLSLTFIEHNATVKRGSKESPYFGNTISFALEDEFIKWMAAMLAGQYPTGILPKYEPLDLL